MKVAGTLSIVSFYQLTNPHHWGSFLKLGVF
jgi:hypothetical protein